MKTLLLTASLASASAFIGYHADTIGAKIVTEVSAEINAAVDYFSYDPQAEFYACIKGVTLRDDDTAETYMARREPCNAHMRAWVMRDGRQAVAEKVMVQGMIDVNRIMREALPGLAANVD